MSTVGFVTPGDPMWLSTLAAMEDELVTDSLVYRYDPSASPDGLRGSEGTFSLCTFAYVDSLARAGQLDKARVDYWVGKGAQLTPTVKSLLKKA